MEFPLMISQTLELHDSEEVSFSTRQDGNRTSISTIARESERYHIRGREKLIQDLKNHGFATNLFPSETTTFGLKLVLGFHDTENNAFNQGYVYVRGMQKLVEEVLGKRASGNDVKIRLDIEHLDAYDSKFVPSTVGYIFNVNSDGKVEQETDTISLTVTNPETASHNSSDWHSRMQWYVDVSLVIILNSGVGEESKPEGLDKLSVNRKMLENEILSDAAIIPESGTELKCHRCVLAARSSVFERMFQADMKEARTGIVDMPGMSEDSVRALLEYMYTWETTAAEENAVICIDLLKAGDKYDMKPLETSMEHILLAKANDWFTADAALQLVLHVKDTELEEVKKRAKELFKSKFEEIRKLSAFEQLVKEEMDTLMALFAYLATY